jgi:two-component system, chemotaxis family, CheB/CheR fusion protein
MAERKNFGSEKDFFVVGIGASAEDGAALAEFFSKVPNDSGMAYVLLSQENAKLSSLKTLTTLPLTTLARSIKVKPNHVYVISANKDVTVVNGKLQPSEPQGKGEPIDRFFRGLAEGLEHRLIAVLLSEKSNNGTLGLRHVKEHWGVTLAADSNESAIAANVVDIALSIAEMPQKLLAIGQTSGKLGLLRERIATLEAPTSSEVAQQTDLPPAEVASDALNNILALIKEKTGHDFHNYKQPTLLRRIARRLQVHELSDMAGYLGFLNKKPEEIKGLIGDLLISVTNFFRDEEAFEALRQDIIPKLFANKTSTDTVRVWSCGCATGEEAYSLAMLFSEYTSTLIDAPKFQIFASDISEEAIRTAREGHYDEKSIQDVSPERLERFFMRDGELYRVKKELRDTVLFTVHNVLRDPPFSRLELISCRNLLIYLNRETQEKVLKLFQFALRPGGFLFLGSSESTESASGLFTTLDKPNRLYQSKATTTAYGALSVLPSAGRWEVKIPDLPTRPAQQRVSYGELHYKFLEGFSPPSLLVNEDDTIVHVSESAGQFLHTSGGEPTRQLFQAVKPALKLAVQRALYEAKKGAGVGTSRNVPIKLEGQDTTVTITVRLVKMLEVKMLDVKMLGAGSGFYIVTFALDQKETEAEVQSAPVATDTQQDGLVTWLEEELQANREGLRMTIEQYETSAEELRASNEELQAVNEELRAASEELETSKEELQSLNEELMTMIDDQKRTELALKESEQRFQAIFEQAAVGIAQVAPDGTFLSVNDRFCEITSYSRGELLSGGFQTITHPDDLASDLRLVNQLLIGERDTYALEKRYLRKNGSTVWVNLTVSLVRNPQSAPHYFISVIEDISERKRQEEALQQQQRFTEGILGAAPSLTYIFDLQEGRNTFISHQTVNVLGYTPEEIQAFGSEVMSYLLHPDDKKAVAERFETALASSSDSMYELEYRMKHKNGSWVWLLSRDQVFARDETGKPTQLLGVATEITERKRSEETLQQANKRFERAERAARGFVFEWTLSTGRVERSSGVTELLGYTLEDLAATFEAWDDFVHPDDTFRLTQERETQLGAGQSYSLEYRVRHKAGHYLYVWDRGEVEHGESGETLRVVGSTVDVTERKQAEAHLRLANERFRIAEDAANGFLYDYNLVSGAESRSEGFAKVLGYSDAEVPGGGAAWEALMHPSDVKHVHDETERALASGEGSARYEYRIRHKNGSWLWVLDRNVIVRGHEGKPQRIIGSIIDISERKRAEEAVRVSEERLSLAIEGAGIGTFDWNIQTGDIHWSPNIETSMAMAPGAFENSFKAFMNYVHPDDRSFVDERIRASIKTGEYECEFRMLKVDGGSRWVIGRGRVFYDKQGKATRMVGVDIDVTTRKEAEQRALHLQRVSAALSGALTPAQVYEVVLREGASTMGSNGGALYLLAGEVLKLAGSQGFSDDVLAGYRNVPLTADIPATRTVLSGQAMWLPTRAAYLEQFPQSELSIETLEFEAALSLPVVSQDQTLGVLAFTFREAQPFDDAQQRFFLTLASMVAQALERTELYQELVDSDEVLREADRRKDEFLAVLAHELRNPLAPIRMSLEIMKLSEDKTMHQEARAVIERQTGQIIRLVDDLLDVSRITRGKINLHKEPVTLAEVLNLAVETTKPLLAEKNHDLGLELPATEIRLEGDKLRLSQVFLNLLTNAAKYSPPESKLTVRAEVDGQAVVVRVQDTGIGIAADSLDKVFDLFARVEAGEAAKQEGLGIGLHLVKRLVEMHSGTISVSSPGLGQGSTFTVRLPMLATEAQKTAPPAVKEQERQLSLSRRVLVVDDYEANRKTLTRMLGLMGHEVTGVSNGQEALDLLEHAIPDFILLDINMPGLSGYEVARRVRENPAYQSIQLVALTGYGAEEDLRKAKEAGFQFHLVKPVDIGVLEELLRTDTAS